MGPRINCLVCGDVIQSKHRHDMVFCSCSNTGVDGGDAYLRVMGDKWEYMDVEEDNDD